jgi:hypothetical protein
VENTTMGCNARKTNNNNNNNKHCQQTQMLELTCAPFEYLVEKILKHLFKMRNGSIAGTGVPVSRSTNRLNQSTNKPTKSN